MVYHEITLPSPLSPQKTIELAMSEIIFITGPCAAEALQINTNN